jgi:hypothetical protein
MKPTVAGILLFLKILLALIALAVDLVVLRLLIRREVGVERSEFMHWLTGIGRLKSGAAAGGV